MTEKIGPEWIQSREKRRIDLALASAAMAPALPMMLGAAGVVAIADHVNPLFIQERTGRDGSVMRMPKIRTLGTVSETIPAHRGYDDPRATTVGHFLRKQHIDELPQLFLIMSGTMSVVGPRGMVLPDQEATRDELSPTEQKEWIYARQVCRPGLAIPYNADQLYSLHDRAMGDIEYSRTASRKRDWQILADCLLASNAIWRDFTVAAKPEQP